MQWLRLIWFNLEKTSKFIKGSYDVVSLSNHLEVIGQAQQCWKCFRFGKEENALDPYVIDQLERVWFTIKMSSRRPIWFAYNFIKEVELKFCKAVLSCRIFVKTHRFWQFQNICCIGLLKFKDLLVTHLFRGIPWNRRLVRP